LRQSLQPGAHAPVDAVAATHVRPCHSPELLIQRRAMTDARAALLAAYLERRDDLLRFFTLRLRSAAAAEDLVQDIYVRIAAIGRDVEVRNASAYLYRLGSNLMLDKIRGERRA